MEDMSTYDELELKSMMCLALLTAVVKQNKRVACKCRNSKNEGWFEIGLLVDKGWVRACVEDEYWDQMDCPEVVGIPDPPTLFAEVVNVRGVEELERQAKARATGDAVIWIALKMGTDMAKAYAGEQKFGKDEAMLCGDDCWLLLKALEIE